MRAAIIAITAAAQCGCYGPVEDRSRVTSTAVIDNGRVALVYHDYRYRPAAGIASFPDGGIPLTVSDEFVVALASADGIVRPLARFRNPALPDTGSVSLQWDREDPRHLYIFRYGQLTHSLPLRYFNEEIRLGLDDGLRENLKLSDQLAADGRELGASGFGTLMPLDNRGTLLVGANKGDHSELWLRPVAGALRMLAEFDRFERRVGPDIVYSINGPPFTTYAMNWDTAAVRTIMRYKLHATGLNWHDFDARDDPAYEAMSRPQEQSANLAAYVRVDGRTITYFQGDKAAWSTKVRF